jgi:putative ABC transport system substrate-binding protein
MNRRRFFFAVGVATVLQYIASTHAAEKVRRIGFLDRGEPAAFGDYADISEWYAAMRELGWIEGQNLVIERRFASTDDLLPVLAQNLVRSKVGLIVAAGGTPTILAAMSATRTIPIVTWSVGDPVAQGIVASLSRPGGNVTGFAVLPVETQTKRISLLREILPGTQKVGDLEDATNPATRMLHNQFEQAYRSLGIQPIFVEVARPDELEGAVEAMTRQRVQAVNVPDAHWIYANRSWLNIVRAASKHRLPVVVDTPQEILEGGALFAYTLNYDELQRRNAAFVDRILRGAKPSDLPVEQPTKFDLEINLQAAKALGITIPQSVLLRAEKVIR